MVHRRRQQAQANNRNFLSLALPVSCRKDSIAWGLVQLFQSDSVMGVCPRLPDSHSLLREQQVDCPAPEDVRARPAEMFQQARLGAASVGQGVGQDGEPWD